LRELIQKRTENLVDSVKSKFNRQKEYLKSDAEMNLEVADDLIRITFSDSNISQSLRIPIPTISEKGLNLLRNNDVVRVMCDYWLERDQKRLNYHDIVKVILCGEINEVMPHRSSMGSLLSRILKASDQNAVPYMVNCVQRLINEIINVMPLHETDMNSWAMNHRLIIIDPLFNALTDPNDRLEYQVEKNEKYYEKFGWSSIGLSENVLADKNFVLTTDLRKLTPYGYYHNPQRNLYSTLGMKGDELPRIRSKSEHELIEKGVHRKGWNLVTAIIDTPLVFEDQILVDKRHAGLSHTVERKFAIYGDKIMVKKGDKISTDGVLGISNDNEKVRMTLRCDEAKVVDVKKELTDVGGEEVVIHIIKVEGKRYFRDGTKFSNLHGNKGIVRLIDLGHAIDPRNGEEVPIDVMISATSINKRANFGQILEALANNLLPKDCELLVLDDDHQTNRKKVENALEAQGFPKDGTWVINTYCGEHSAIVGKMFWGVTKDPEDQLWEGNRTLVTDNREIRTSGLKFSHVEFKALTTRFGPKNAIAKEVLSYAQGVEILHDEISILKSAKGELPKGLPEIDASSIRYVDNSGGIFHTAAEIAGTVVDEAFLPEGFILKLPCDFQVIINKDDLNRFTCGMPQEVQDPEEKITYQYNKIFIPNALLRRCWRHPSGKWGLSVTGARINRIIEWCHKFIATKDISAQTTLMKMISGYFLGVAKMMGTKNGELSTYGMAVRYPHSTRATAALADNKNDYPDELKYCVVDNLPRDTIEIHRDMANQLKVTTGDVVLVERFPCLGFMSIRPQYVRVTDDPQCKYVIRVSGNSLTSENLDFDGDTIYLASFHTPQAKEALRREIKNSETLCKQVIEQMNAKKVPQIKEMSLNDFDIRVFPPPSNEEHANLVRNATGVKSHTGPVIALAYNLMRIVERNVPYADNTQHVHLEVLLDFLGNTVFKQKHGIKSLQQEATDAICLADVERMVELGFEREPSELLCGLIKKEAESIGVRDLKWYYKTAKERGWSKIINLIVRKKNRVYFATRSTLGPFNLLDHLKDGPVDLPSFMMDIILKMNKIDIEERLNQRKFERAEKHREAMLFAFKGVYKIMSNYIEEMMSDKTKAMSGSCPSY